MGNGYIIVPRGLFDAADWQKKRVFGRTEAQLDLIYLASYIDGRVIHCTSGDVELCRGQLLTTMRTLATRWGWSSTSVHRFLSSLRQPKAGEIRIEIETQIETGKTLITILDYNAWSFFEEIGTPIGTAPVTPSGTPIGTATNGKAEHANGCKIGDSESKRNNGSGESEIPTETAPETPSGTRNGTILEIKYRNKGINKDNTHTVLDNKGGVGENWSEAMALVQWVVDTHPSLARIRKPLTVEFATEILDRYDRVDAEHIINSMADDMVTLTKGNFKQRFDTFAKCDLVIKPKRDREKHYTYTEYCDEITSGRAKSEDFQTIRTENGVYWIKKTK